jgi:hypothetical protein
MLLDALYEYVKDCENPELNFNLALEYKKIGQTASAISFFIRSADRTNNLELSYECLLHCAECFIAQDRRDNTVRGLYKHAISILPKRPEAYFLLARFEEKKSQFDNTYMLSSMALEVCDFESKPLIHQLGYPGKYGLIFEKAVSSYWWGKGEESRKLFLDLYYNYWNILDQSHKDAVQANIKNLNIEVGSIPVIGVPIVNGVHWLKRLIDSVDYPVENFFIVNNNGRGQIDKELDEICNSKHPFIKKFHVSHLPSNLGCGGAWNLIIKSYMMKPYWIIVNHDVEFSPGLLKLFHDEAINSEYGMIHGKNSDWGGGMYDLFLIKDWVVQKCGLFDENLYPAYAEDVDYHIRVKNENIKYKSLNANYLHGEKDYSTTGSQTWRTDINLKEGLNKSRILNETEYLVKKWGSNFEYLTPFNDDVFSNNYTTYDLNFNREKNLGF